MALINQTVILTLVFMVSDAAKILGIFPYPSYSHQRPLHAVTMALSKRGHDVTVITTHPANDAPANYKQIDVSFTGPEISKKLDRKMINNKGTLAQLAYWENFVILNCDIILGSKVVQDFLKTNESKKFDAVILETNAYPCFYGLVRHIGSPPLIGILSTMMQTQNYLGIGSVNNPSYMPHTQLPTTDHISFLHRLKNVFFNVAYTLKWDYTYIPTQEVISSRYFGKNLIPLYVEDRNISFLISNCNWLFSYPQPYNPNVLCVSGSHINKKTKPLPEKIQTFIDSSSEGFVYVSLGSQIRSSDLTKEMEATFVETFRKLKLKILWKYENENIANLPSNVMTGKWLPQQDILAQKNIRLFVNQGGLQSLQEALYHAVPMLIMPFAVDQHYNAVNVVEKGLAATIPISNFQNETLEKTINSILNNESHQINANRYSSHFKEHLEKSLERGLWWIEYVVRHRGARHLRSPSHSLDNVEGYLLDVILVTVSVLVVLCYAISKLITLVRLSGCTTRKNKSKPH